MEENNPQTQPSEIDTLLRFGALVNSSLRIEEVLETAMKWIEESIGTEASSIFELDEEKGDELFVRLARGDKKDPAGRIRVRLGEGIAGWVAKTGQPIVVQDVGREERFQGTFDRVTGFKTRSMICVPLIHRGRPSGAVQVLNKRGGAPFTEADLRLLTGMAQQIAVAVENAGLYRRLEEKFEITAGELRAVQEKLLRSERLSAIGHLVEGLAHEIRNPTTMIGGFAERIRKAFPGDRKIEEYTKIILEEVNRLETLVRQVHLFAEIQTATISPGEIGPVITDVIGQFQDQARSRSIEITVHVEDGLPPIPMDAKQITLGLFNLVENAIEAMSRGGRLDLHASLEGRQVLITIEDTGSGIPEDHLASVCDPFFTSKTRGVGLGLTIAQQIIRNHQGEIRIESIAGKGTVVRIGLPIGFPSM